MLEKTYYEILNVSSSATEQEIKTSYRKLVKKYHPDVSTEANARQMFIDIKKAYDTLSDMEKKRMYDRTLQGEKFTSSASQTAHTPPTDNKTDIKRKRPDDHPGYKVNMDDWTKADDDVLRYFDLFANFDKMGTGLPPFYTKLKIFRLKRERGLFVTHFAYFYMALYETLHMFFFWLFDNNPLAARQKMFYYILGLVGIFSLSYLFRSITPYMVITYAIFTSICITIRIYNLVKNVFKWIRNKLRRSA